MRQPPEDYIFLVTTTVMRMSAKDLPTAVTESLKRRNQGYRTEIVFREHELDRRGLNGQMQDLIELSEDFGLINPLTL